jgi:hypothetical protein
VTDPERRSDIMDFHVHLPSGDEVELSYTGMLQRGDTFTMAGDQWRVENLEIRGDERHISVVEDS